MARKKSDELSEFRPEKPPEQVIDPDDAEIDEIFMDFPQNDACIELFRVNAQGGRPMFLEQITPAVFSFSYVCEKFGGGKYFARGKYKTGERVRLPFDIEGDPIPVRVRGSASAQERPVPLMPQIQAEYTPESADPYTAMMGLVKVMMGKMENSEEAFLRKMQLYKEVLGVGVKQDTPLDTAITMFQKGLEMAGNSSMAETNPWIMLAKEFREPLTKIVDTVQMAMNRPSVAQQPNPRPNPTVQPAIQPTQQPAPPTVEQPDMVTAQFLAYMPMLLQAASKNVDPATYADLILDQVPESAYHLLRNWLGEVGCLDRLATYEPAIRYQMQWWEALRNELLSAMSEPNADAAIQSAENSGSPTGHTTARV